jgi:nucleoside-diphosphate-sugar epimerase
VAAYADIYEVKIPIQRVDWSEFSKSVVTDPGARYHFQAHMCPDISETRARLGYEPRFTPQQTMRRAVEWMKSQRMLGPAC